MRKENIEIGAKFGEMTIIRDDGIVNKRRVVWCRCSCGNEKQVDYSHLKRGNIKTCGKCIEKKICAGYRFGEWEVIGTCEDIVGKPHRYALCKCSCGNEKLVAYNKLLSGKSLSCGCWRSGAKNYPKRLYVVWGHMKSRCYNPNDKKYKQYGGRGIKVCKEWLNFHGFAEWALNAEYQEDAAYGECTLDRIDVNGDYCPENCRWANQYVQGNNKQNTVRLEYRGENHTISEWANILNMPRDLIDSRYRKGYPIEDIFFNGHFSTHKRRLL